MKKIYFLLFLLSLFCSLSFAQRQHTLLVINAYNESEPWVNDLAQPIAMHLAANDSVNYEIASLENALITDSVMYQMVTDNIFQCYAEKHPDYIVMIGNLAFNMRDRIKEEWGDIPMLLISRTPYFGNLEDYYTTNEEYIPEAYGTLIESVRQNYNMTALIVPDYSRETVDLMVQMNPKMKELVFLTTNIFVQRRTAAIIAGHLHAHYKGIEFKMVKASEENSEQFQKYIINRHPETGLLIGSWVYERINARGTKELSTNDIRLVASSKTPVFSMLEIYRSLGSLGGVYVNNDKVKQEMISIIQKMLEGKSMRDIPFFTTDEKVTYINYRRLKEYNIPESYCPDDTQFLSKPQGFWEEYFWQAIAAILTLAILLIVFYWRIREQRKEIKRLNYMKFFLNNMPVPYAQADITVNNGKVENIAYTNMNLAFELLIAENSLPDSPSKLFPTDFIATKILKMKEEKNVEFNFHFDKSDTDYEFILCDISTKLRNEDSTITTIDIFGRDITKNLRMENQIRRNTEKLDLSLRVSKLVPWQWYVDRGKIVFDDRDILSHSKSYKISIDGEDMWEITFTDFLRSIHPEDVKMFVQLVDDLHKHLYTHFTQQVRMQTHNDDPFDIEYDWVELTAAVTSVDENGEDMLVTGSLKNINESRKQEEALKEALAKAKEADRMKSTFLANMSHEIRTPLNAIIGFSNIIADSVADDKFAKIKEIINSNNELLLNLIGDVLDLAKIESNTIDLQLTPTDINKLISSAEQTVRFRVHRNVMLRTVLAKSVCITEADSVRVTQVIINFLTNACKFTTQGTITCGYELRKQNVTTSGEDGSATQEMLYIYVKDTGIGLSRENKDKVFGQFVKLNNFAQGTGLGLAISKRLVELMGGEIGVNSDGPGFGSTFWFTLPYKPCAKQYESQREEFKVEKHEKATRTNITQPKGNIRQMMLANKKPLMLIAENNESNYMLMEQLLKDSFNLIHAYHGGEALTLFTMQQPDIILMDINMPYVDGYEATRRIREISTTVPIIAVTAYAYSSDRSRIMQSGFNGYISKPISQKALDEILSEL